MGVNMRPLLLAPFLLLAACEPEPENIQAKAETVSRQLEERANQIRAEAENDVEAQAAPLESEADALLNQIANNNADANSTASANLQ
jgi:starvation-inducible outer membrane lipoprotein